MCVGEYLEILVFCFWFVLVWFFSFSFLSTPGSRNKLLEDDIQI